MLAVLSSCVAGSGSTLCCSHIFPSVNGFGLTLVVQDCPTHSGFDPSTAQEMRIYVYDLPPTFLSPPYWADHWPAIAGYKVSIFTSLVALQIHI